MADPFPVPPEGNPPVPPRAVPTAPPRPPAPPPRRFGFGCLLPVLVLFLAFSLLVNVVLAAVLSVSESTLLDLDSHKLPEKFYLGDRDASDKVAVVRLEGVISDSGIKFPVQQLEKAAKDKNVKAVVLRIDSPGGTVTASDEVYQSVVNLRDNTGRRFPGSGPKPVAVSMGGVAASGGYYAAVAGKPIHAERTTITGSIGVFAALPNVAEFGDKYGIKVELIKAGAVKGSGSFFHTMSPDERQTWQDTVDSSYDVFLSVISQGRPGLTKERLRDEVVIDRMIPRRDGKGNVIDNKAGKPELVKYTRVRADGGTFTADQAKQFGLIDDVQDLPATVRAAAQAAGLTSFKAVTYDRPPTAFDVLFGNNATARQSADPLDAGRLANSLTPRLWYLSPGADGGILAPGP